MINNIRAALPLLASLLLAGCSAGTVPQTKAENTAETSEHAQEEGHIQLTPVQIQAAGISLVQPLKSGGGTITLPATVESDP